VDSDTQITVSPAFSGSTSGDTVSINTMPINDDTLDDIYFALVYGYPTASTLGASIQYVSPIYYRVNVRNNRDVTNGKIQPFTSDGSVTSGTDNQTIQTVRNPDNITT